MTRTHDIYSLDGIPPKSIVLVAPPRGRQYCDHGTELIADCKYCEAALRLVAYRPTIPVKRRLGPDALGCCDSCGVEVPMAGHLYKALSGYLCEECIEHVNDCTEVGI